MFSIEEKQKIAKAIEKVLLEINHPEMPKEKPKFTLHVEGEKQWSWADIQPNWTYDEHNKPTSTEWNENARAFLSR